MCAKYKQDHISEIQAHRKEKNENLERSRENLRTKINVLKKKKTILQNRCDDSHEPLLKLKVKRTFTN